MKELFYKYINECTMLMNEKTWAKWSVIYVYNVQCLRQKKLSRILDKNITCEDNFREGEIIIEQDLMRRELRIHPKIWNHFKTKFKLTDEQVSEKLKEELTDDKYHFIDLTPITSYWNSHHYDLNKEGWQKYNLKTWQKKN